MLAPNRASPIGTVTMARSGKRLRPCIECWWLTNDDDDGFDREVGDQSVEHLGSGGRRLDQGQVARTPDRVRQGRSQQVRLELYQCNLGYSSRHL